MAEDQIEFSGAVARQGSAEFQDADRARHDDLLLARRGTAYFARILNALSDTELDLPSLRAGWSRRRIIATVSYQARALANAINAVRTGQRPRLKVSDRELVSGATLPARALRHLFHHTAVHLDAEWRDLRAREWEAVLELPDGSQIALSQTPIVRAKELWSGAVDLGNGGKHTDIPERLLNLQNLQETW